MEGFESVANPHENPLAISTQMAGPPQNVTSLENQDPVDPRDIHATDRTFGSAVRTILQLLVLSVAIGRQYTTATTVVSAIFISYALALLVFAGMRHHLNLMSIKRGIIRVDGITPLFFFVLGIAASISALIYTAHQVAISNDLD